MDFYGFLLILFVLFNNDLGVQCKAYYSNRVLNRSDAESECNLYGRERSGQFNKVNIQTDAPTNTLMWISAESFLSEWYSYKGCYIVESAMNTSSVRNSVGFCSQFCKSYPLFALGESLCYCLQSLPIQKSTSCLQTPCPGDSKDYCGTDVSVLVYQKMNILSEIGNCVAMTTFGSYVYYSTNDCNDKYGYICKNYDDTYIYFPELRTWNDAIQRCYERGRTISDTYLILGPSSSLPNGVSAWVGIFRKEIFFWNGGNVSSNCVAGSLGDRGDLTPVTTSCSYELPVLCTDGTEIKTTIHTPQMNTSKNLTLIISGSSAIGVMILFIVILFCCYSLCSKAKQKPRKQKLENEETTDTEKFENMNEPGVKGAVNGNYNVLEVTENSNVERRPPTFKTFKERISGYYNSLVFGRKKKKLTNSCVDIYDHIELNNDPYNHPVKPQIVNSQRVAVAGIYDHMSEFERTPNLNPSHSAISQLDKATEEPDNIESENVNVVCVYNNISDDKENQTNKMVDREPYYNAKDIARDDQIYYYDDIP